MRARAGGRVELLAPSGASLATVAAPLRVTGAAPLRVPGVGSYRGALEFRPGTFGGVNVINAIDVDDYVKGVVPLESPASWPIEALKAQAVAARTYALTTSKGGTGWDHYTDTRSQVYGGANAEQASTNAAVDATAGELVTYNGEPVATYFFSTSGGRTEDVENTSLGTAPVPWLKSVKDKYDSVSPRHRWGPIRMGRATAGAKLSGLVKGRFRGIKVVRRGRSPRIVAANIVGTGGRTRVDGATIRARLGLYDTWAYFTSIKTGKAPKPEEPAGPPTPVDPGTGGTSPGAADRGHPPRGRPARLGHARPPRRADHAPAPRRRAAGSRSARCAPAPAAGTRRRWPPPAPTASAIAATRAPLCASASVPRSVHGTLGTPGRPLYFLHVPKTAGSAFTRMLDDAFPVGTRVPAEYFAALGGTPLAEAMRGHGLLAGHFGLRPLALGPLTTVTVLREPAARTWSHFKYMAEHGREHTFETFLADPLDGLGARDYQARWLGTPNAERAPDGTPASRLPADDAGRRPRRAAARRRWSGPPPPRSRAARSPARRSGCPRRSTRSAASSAARSRSRRGST